MADVAQPAPEALLAEVRRLELENALLREMIRRFRLEKFGRPSEKLTDAQLALLAEEPSVQTQEVAQEAQLPAEQKQAVERQARST
jgi:hypothetical protein